ncbi:geminin coiled-coil domain-containing protein 1 [Anguilla anguilla]|uniref:geminin coiled-coil domain-containing protein 1 n=1 Tax=Anguilla anguilla TaxID=7936 RepID=UPI0015ACA6B0|nr:geminin coiled-coil domain-containing protein 1 [Anguilla anguilla]
MSTAVSCQEPSFVGGQRYDCPYSVPTSAESVDVSKETVVSFWTAGPLDNTVCLHEPSQHEAFYNLGYETEPTWNDHLSPQLQRNKQLQDTLLQREEELARLQEENNKLKEFLNSSVVKCLEAKAKKLLSASRSTGARSRKRIQQDDGFTSSQLLSGTHGKRTCRNLTPEVADTLPMDSWVLQTLGLKDEDTIDPSANYSSSINPAANFSPEIDPSSNYSTDTNHTANCSSHLNSSPNFRSSISSTRSCSNINSSVNYISNINPPNPSPSIDPSANSSPSIDLSANPNSDCTAPLFAHLADVLQLPDPLDLRPRLSSLPELPCDMETVQHHAPAAHCLESDCSLQTQPAPASESAPHYLTPCPPRGRTEVAFSMSLEPRSSVRTHSFSQGQAFVCKDTRGGWNFTWVPKDTS